MQQLTDKNTVNDPAEKMPMETKAKGKMPQIVKQQK